MASVFAVPRGQIVRDIYSGAVLPFVAAALDVGVGQAWKVMLVVEYLCGSDGLGAQILAARGRIDLPAVWALTMVAVALGLLTERTVTATLTRVTRSWQPC
jgi:NitT/TauT family transport system permease protein